MLYSWHKSPAQTIQDTFSHELIVAANGAASRLNWVVLNSVVGTKLKIISGYPEPEKRGSRWNAAKSTR